MAETRINADWDRTSTILALIAETHRNPEVRRRPFRPAEFHPATARRTRRRSMTDTEATAALYALAGQTPPTQPRLWDQLKAEHGNHVQDN